MTAAPSIATIAQKLSDRAARAATILEAWDNERALPQARRSLQSFAWQPHGTDPAVQVAVIWHRGSAPEAYRVRVSCAQVADGRWEVVHSDCQCGDAWGKTWLGTCKHQLAARALVARSLAKYGHPHTPAQVPASVVALPGSDAALARSA